MTWVDLAVLGVLALSGLLACMRGLVREVLGIGAWIGAIAIASNGQALGRGVAAQWISDPQLASAASFVTLLLISVIVLSVIARILSKVVKGSMLGGIDRTLGLVFGLVRGAVLAIVVYIVACMAIAIDHWPEPFRDARSLPYIYQGAVWVREYLLPEEYRPRLYAPPSVATPPSEALLHATPTGRAVGK
jgi:membrane protein required for colicin V production